MPALAYLGVGMAMEAQEANPRVALFDDLIE